MRPLEEVLATARQRGERLNYCDCYECLAAHHELVEWENKLCEFINGTNTNEMLAKLPEIRRLLGRTEPEQECPPFDEATAQRILAKAKAYIEEPPEISQATAMRLMTACNKIITAEVDVCLRPDCRVPTCHAIREVKSALAAARAELAGEATNAPVRHTDE